MPIATYLSVLTIRHKTGISREHSYRGDLQTLLGTLLKDVLVTNEPAHGRVLDYEDIAHYQKIMEALQVTKRIMGEIDRQSPLP